MLLSYAKKKTKTKTNPLVWLQLLLAVLSTKSVLQDVAEDRPFVVSSKAALVELFFFPEANGGVRVSNTKRNVAFVYDSNALIRSIESTVERYFHLPELALNELELIEKDGIEVRLNKLKNLDFEGKGGLGVGPLLTLSSSSPSRRSSYPLLFRVSLTTVSTRFWMSVATR